MFLFRSQTVQSESSSKNTSTKTSSKWFGKKTIVGFSNLVDSTLSNISDQILRQAADVQYQTEFNRVQRETLANENSLGIKPRPNTLAQAESSDPEIDQLKKTLANHYRYKQNLSKSLTPPAETSTKKKFDDRINNKKE